MFTMTSFYGSIMISLLFLHYVICLTSADFVSLPRWGQATAVINNHLFTHGGKTDQFNSFSYTSAYTNNDLLHLDLSQSFDPSSPPWLYVAGSENTSTPQGPILAWHTLSAYNTSQLLLFGGDGGPNSPIVLPDRADSASLLSVDDILAPQWISENMSWLGEPLRRIHHSVSSAAGKLWITGGEKDDGSSLGYSQHYVFDPDTPAFTQLPSENGPPDLYGHSSVVLSDGRLVVFGGYSPSQSQLLPLSTIWSMDTTQQTLSWSTLSVSDSSLPPPRRAFISTLLENDQILIHGGADSVLQTSYDDGWILDTTKNPMVWSSVSELTQLGPRRDHFAVTIGSQVIFGFGYAENAAASAALSVFDSKNHVFLSSFTPSATSSQTTLPLPSNTSTSGQKAGSGVGTSSTSGDNRKGSGSQTSLRSSATSGSSGNAGGSPGNTNGSGDSNRQINALAAALGTIFGCLLLLVIVVLLYRRRKHRQLRSFRRIGGDENDNTPSRYEKPEMAGNGWVRHVPGRNWNIWTMGSRSARRDISTNVGQRFDILADEDERQFDVRSFSMFREGSGSSRSWYSGRGQSQRSASGDVDINNNEKSRWVGVVNESLSSLRHVGVVIGNKVRKVSGGTIGRDRDTDRLRSGEWWEKDDPLSDPFSDDAAFLHPDTDNTIEAIVHSNYPEADDLGTAARIRGGLQSLGSSSQYKDPFVDRNSFETSIRNEILDPIPHVEGPDTISFNNNSYNIPDTSRSNPLTTVSSHDTVADQAASLLSQDSPSAISIQDNLGSSTRPRTNSLIGASTTPVQPVKRSDSWWARLKRTPFRDISHESVRSPSYQHMEFRDPNPAPRLVSIREASNSLSPTSPESSESKRRLRSSDSDGGVYSLGGHERSMSSLRTAKTADSEAIEKMAAMVDVVQRAGTTASHQSYPSSDSNGSKLVSHVPRSIAQQVSEVSGISVSDSLRSSIASDTFDPEAERTIFESPVTDDLFGIIGMSRQNSFSQQESMARRAARGKVAPRIAEIEQRISMDYNTKVDSPTRSQRLLGSPAEKKTRTETPISYGLVQRAELIVANPDRGSES